MPSDSFFFDRVVPFEQIEDGGDNPFFQLINFFFVALTSANTGIH